MPFRTVNRRGHPGHDPGLQRHHLLPRQLLGQRCFCPLFAAIGRERIGFDDFRANGLLLPASDEAAVRMAMPLHRGPHRAYNALVIERVGQVEAGWAAARHKRADAALETALFRLSLLQGALRRRLLVPMRGRLTLNRHDPHGRPIDYSDLDAMADLLWPETETESAFSA